ncbi:MAG: selenide, water dikinase SelD [Parasporobacterium sp.]|nr:selenide, water dikinase SelD [Parasporobacterium sp.]
MKEEIIFCKSGGCSAKLGAAALDRILSQLDKRNDPDLLVGYDGRDDGAVYRISDDCALVSTLDFFPPMVEEPYTFGQIAAANALSDIYAMGGRVLTALNIVCFPEKSDLNILGKILQGGNDKVNEAGGVLAGGHSINDEDIKYGLSVTGVVNPGKIYRNNTPREGDMLILTKPLGTGIVMAAHRVGEASPEAYDKAVKSMTTLNKYAAEILADFDVHACSDVTGFGFLVHLSEMLGEDFSAAVYSDQIPYFPECEEYINEFYLTGAAQRNRNRMEGKVLFEKESFIMEEILYDPQTSGGLLIAADPAEAPLILEKMNSQGIRAKIVGRVETKAECIPEKFSGSTEKPTESKRQISTGESEADISRNNNYIVRVI